MSHTAVGRLVAIGGMLLPILLYVIARKDALGCVGYVFVQWLCLGLLRGGAKEAESPVGEVEAAEDDDCGEDLFEHQVVSRSLILFRDLQVDAFDEAAQ
jgi:hypothetical protein